MSRHSVTNYLTQDQGETRQAFKNVQTSTSCISGRCVLARGGGGTTCVVTLTGTEEGGPCWPEENINYVSCGSCMEGSPPSYSAVSPYLGQYVTPRLLALQSQANLTGIPWSWLMGSQKYFYFLSSAEHNYAESFQVNSKNHCRIIDLLTCHQQLWKVFSLLFIYSSVSATDNWPDCPSLSVNCPLILTTDRIILVKRVAVQGTTWRAIITKQFHYAAVSHQWRLTNCLGSLPAQGEQEDQLLLIIYLFALRHQWHAGLVQSRSSSSLFTGY